MKKILTIGALLLLTAACSQNNAMTESNPVTITDLEHHNYVLVSVDGKPFPTAKNAMSPNIAFGENMHISGSMCNNFFGQGELSQASVLTAKGVGMTRKFCSDQLLNQLDQKIGSLLEGGAKVSLDNQQNLTLSNDKTTLVFKLKDYVN